MLQDFALCATTIHGLFLARSRGDNLSTCSQLRGASFAKAGETVARVKQVRDVGEYANTPVQRDFWVGAIPFQFTSAGRAQGHVRVYKLILLLLLLGIAVGCCRTIRGLPWNPTGSLIG